MVCGVRLFLVAMAVLASLSAAAQTAFTITRGQPLTVWYSDDEEEVVHTALAILRKDIRSVFAADMVRAARDAQVVAATIGTSDILATMDIDLSALRDRRQAFLLAVADGGQLVVAGSDKRGTAYGLMEVSRLVGVSPWEWWADSRPQPQEAFSLPPDYRRLCAPSVEYRGIFINDEDWGFTPWSSTVYAPTGVAGEIAPATHERVFELLLRLRANLFWPAMHSCTLPFFYTAGNRAAAARYGIFVGTSHCEPMMRNTNGEWARDGSGNYDYVHNRDNVLAFWEARVRDIADGDNIYTLGIRGVHDGAMEGATTVEERLAALTAVVRDQRSLLAKYVDADVERVPQVFIPYKEVLDVYHAGLAVPDDVTLVWCDDNYGYIRHFPTTAERVRRGGNGIYYHVSYWGAPHDYLWLATTSPSLLFQQMTTAWQQGIQRLWVVNVGDIKPAEYLTELFLDMAWDIEEVAREGSTTHLLRFLQREFGESVGTALLPLMQEYYRLSFIRRPEFMGNTRVYERDSSYAVVSDLPWRDDEIARRLAAYQHLADSVVLLREKLPREKRDSYFQLVEYPLTAAAQQNKKCLLAQLARHGKAEWQASDAAYDSIQVLTAHYNSGKWQGMMSCQPRQLPVFARLPHTVAADSLSLPTPLYEWDGADYSRGTATAIDGLGSHQRAAAVAQGDSVVFAFSLPATVDTVDIEVRLLPCHPITSVSLRFALSVDGEQEKIVAYDAPAQSEAWKENVLRNYACATLRLPLAQSNEHEVVVAALDEGVVLDALLLYVKDMPPQ